MSTPLLELRGVTRRYGAREALSRVDLDLHEGEILVVLGPTGAGKTTLLRVICGLEAPDGGSLALGGRDLAGVGPAERDVALVFQNFSLYPDWTVRRNLEFPLRAPARTGGRALAESEIRERVERAAATLRIEALLDRLARRLSGGEMQRVAIGRAIVRKPRLFLMDEPLSNLDAKLREALRVELAVLVRSLGVPMIYVTHDQGEALSMADRIAVLVDGRIQQVGTPREIYDRPCSPLVACQLGQPRINLFEARVEAERLLSGAGTSLCPAPGHASGPVRLGVRAEHLRVVDPGPDAAVVELVEQAGPEQLLVAHWAGQRVHVLVDRSREFHVGERIGLAVEEDRAVLWPSP